MARSIMVSLKALLKRGIILALLFSPLQSVFAENALVIRGKSQAFLDVVKGLTEDLEGELKIEQLVIDKNTSTKTLTNKINQLEPKVIILVGNKSVNLYAGYQAENKGAKFPPAIAVAALFIDRFIDKLSNATAIRYEIPAVTSAVSMRSILKKPIKKVGVVYREWMDDLIQENREYAQSEGIELVAVKLPNKASDIDSRVKNALDDLNKEVDALWILNDNGLLTSEVLTKAWIPVRTKSSIPAIVGVKIFLQKIPLGSFAIVPDDYSLGSQLAGLIFETMDNDWELEDTDIKQPISVKKFINQSTLDQKQIGYDPAKLKLVDEVVK